MPANGVNSSAVDANVKLQQLYDDYIDRLHQTIAANPLSKEDQQLHASRMQALLTEVKQAAADNKQRPTSWLQRFALLNLLTTKYWTDLPISANSNWMSAARAVVSQSAGDRHKSAVLDLQYSFQQLFASPELQAELKQAPMTSGIQTFVQRVALTSEASNTDFAVQMEALRPDGDSAEVVAFDLLAMALIASEGPAFELPQLERVAGSVQRYLTIMELYKNAQKDIIKQAAIPCAGASSVTFLYSASLGMGMGALLLGGLYSSINEVTLVDCTPEQRQQIIERATAEIGAFNLQLKYLLAGTRALVPGLAAVSTATAQEQGIAPGLRQRAAL